ncbi:NACHT domain-containing protein [Winogradskya humida]|uniref:AAA+ ATPase domain-containing protein n=1 Tax=Winogradskya humida TaxID=113566 RepID=A0ABQ3ZXJ4_9ACTN|nr:AAA family ATPase [Actinoplanes humidus]GIE23229.1 hypothetical protein Ahu01nite_063310 [Actinoplanes humidus]
MRTRSLTYADALRLLGKDENEAVAALSRLTGVTAGVVTVASAGTVDFFALRGELVKWGHDTVRGLRDRASGIRRFDRTELLVAAHAVVVITAFFEALDEAFAAAPGLDLTDAELTAQEQVALSTGTGLTESYAAMVGALIDQPPPMPTPLHPFEDLLAGLSSFYGGLSRRILTFLAELAAFADKHSRLESVVFSEALTTAAVSRYQLLYRSLIAAAPEFGIWVNTIESQATRHVVRVVSADLGAEIARLRSVLTAVPLPVDAVRQGLGVLHRQAMERPVLAAQYAPDHVMLPSLGQGYLNPSGQMGVAGRNSRPSTEDWWAASRPVPDVQDFLLACLTSVPATSSLLVVLGQPGSGKSALTRVLAARLPESDFLVVRVELRTVPADTQVQNQIEEALYQALGERVVWPELARRSGSALPVIIMDGFDELLQASGLNRADYLEQLRAFQDRERDLGRPVAILVTSRTVVADRARFPAETTVVRLAPFDDDQVGQWLAIWNTANADALAERGLYPLPDDVALAHPELAREPLLLLLLALYDASTNALQNSGTGLGRVDLYERLFSDFVRREVDKGHPGDRRDDEIDAEWRRLGVVALSILNRGGDVILDTELDRDLPHLLGPASTAPDPDALSPSQVLVGRFFFIHEACATRDTGGPRRSFEFLHATFGDFLAARLIVGELVDTAQERLHQRRRRSQAGTLDAGFLYAATSFVTIARRAPLWDFCAGVIARLTAADRELCRELVIELLPEAGYPHPTWSLAGYEARRKPSAARHAAFSANLVCLAVLLSDRPVDIEELVGQPDVTAWRDQALLWHSMLDPEDRRRLWQQFRVSWHLDERPPRLRIRLEDNAAVSVKESLPWPPAEVPDPGLLTFDDIAAPATSRTGRLLRRCAFVQTTIDSRELIYALTPALALTPGPEGPVMDDRLFQGTDAGGARRSTLREWVSRVGRSGW